MLLVSASGTSVQIFRKCNYGNIPKMHLRNKKIQLIGRHSEWPILSIHWMRPEMHLRKLGDILEFLGGA